MIALFISEKHNRLDPACFDGLDVQPLVFTRDGRPQYN